jgi:hypothetical protein
MGLGMGLGWDWVSYFNFRWDWDGIGIENFVNSMLYETLSTCEVNKINSSLFISA